MLTFFTTPKPFRDQFELIQYRALQSWSLLHPRPEILVFGDEEGTKKAAGQLGLTHLPEVKRNDQGTPLISSMFESAQQIARYPLMAYINCDILLLDDFFPAVQRIQQKQFMIVGQRCDLDLPADFPLFEAGWQDRLAAYARQNGSMRGPTGIDYFVFPRGLLTHLPEFAVGRIGWDTWMMYHIRSRGIPLIDATESILAIHQNHDYSHYPGGYDATRLGEEAQKNIDLAGGWENIFTIDDASHLLKRSGLKRQSLPRLLRSNARLHPRLRPLFNLLIRTADSYHYRSSQLKKLFGKIP